GFSSGLCYYYFLSQIFTMIIMFVIRRTVNDEQVRAKLMSHKPKKKSKFQERYEEALRQQQDQMTINREMRRHQNR
ncbi:MAG: membrane protein insertase YidC, partial [Alistipes sp.]|nr:membrane protein insertase YidC [Alistipes sp.]